MGKIYKNQYSLSLTLDSDITLTGATATKIKYIKPDGTNGEFDATISGTDSLIYEFTANDELDQSGDWIFWNYVTFSDNRIAPGEPVIIRVYEEGN